MKALTVKNPWATLIAQGKKTIETRTWATNYRGPLLICASTNPSGSNAGHAVCIADLVDIRPMLPQDEAKACCKLYPKAKAWILDNIRPIDPPFPVRGWPGLFEIPYRP